MKREPWGSRINLHTGSHAHVPLARLHSPPSPHNNSLHNLASESHKQRAALLCDAFRSFLTLFSHDALTISRCLPRHGIPAVLYEIPPLRYEYGVGG